MNFSSLQSPSPLGTGPGSELGKVLAKPGANNLVGNGVTEFSNIATKMAEETVTMPKPKKPYKELNLEEKVTLIRMAQDNPRMSQAELAKIFGIAKSNVCRILKRRQEYLSVYECASFSGERKRKLRDSDTKELNMLVAWWVRNRFQKGESITGPMIQEKAREFAQLLSVSNFVASNGWLQSFQKSYFNTLGLNSDIISSNNHNNNNSINSLSHSTSSPSLSLPIATTSAASNPLPTLSSQNSQTPSVHSSDTGNETLRAHMYKQHQISRMFMCRCCNWAFPDKTSLHIHMQSMASGTPGNVSIIAKSSSGGASPPKAPKSAFMGSSPSMLVEESMQETLNGALNNRNGGSIFPQLSSKDDLMQSMQRLRERVLMSGTAQAAGLNLANWFNNFPKVDASGVGSLGGTLSLTQDDEEEENGVDVEGGEAFDRDNDESVKLEIADDTHGDDSLRVDMDSPDELMAEGNGYDETTYGADDYEKDVENDDEKPDDLFNQQDSDQPQENDAMDQNDVDTNGHMTSSSDEIPANLKSPDFSSLRSGVSSSSPLTSLLQRKKKMSSLFQNNSDLPIPDFLRRSVSSVNDGHGDVNEGQSELTDHQNDVITSSSSPEQITSVGVVSPSDTTSSSSAGNDRPFTSEHSPRDNVSDSSSIGGPAHNHNSNPPPGLPFSLAHIPGLIPSLVGYGNRAAAMNQMNHHHNNNTISNMNNNLNNSSNQNNINNNCFTCQILKGKLGLSENRSRCLERKVASLESKINRLDSRIATMDSNTRRYELEGKTLREQNDSLQNKLLSCQEKAVAFLQKGVGDSQATQKFLTEVLQTTYLGS